MRSGRCLWPRPKKAKSWEQIQQAAFIFDTSAPRADVTVTQRCWEACQASTTRCTLPYLTVLILFTLFYLISPRRYSTIKMWSSTYFVHSCTHMCTSMHKCTYAVKCTCAQFHAA
jgi:hypothetical protein